MVSEQVEVSVTCDKSDRSDKGVCRVSPGEAVVLSGGTITFTNDTLAPVHIQVSTSRLDLKQLPIPSKESRQVKVPEQMRGWFPYSVFCECTSDFAIGGSMPIIIIVRR